MEQVLLKWKGGGISVATWENKNEFNVSQLSSDLKDTVVTNGGGVDTCITHTRPKSPIRKHTRFAD